MSTATTEASGPQTMAEFLSETPPYALRTVKEMLEKKDGYDSYQLSTPPIRLHCGDSTCGGDRWFSTRPYKPVIFSGDGPYVLRYRCDNCEKISTIFTVVVERFDKNPNAEHPTSKGLKIGQWPPFGSPVPSSLLELIGPDREEFLKGRRAENQGMGIGAFAYYRRIVEAQKDRIIDAFIKVAKRTAADATKVTHLEAAKQETQFSRAIDSIKEAIPDALRIDGHNPLTLMHDALSDGLHALSDAECLEYAEALRVVLTRFAERTKEILREERELETAVSKLMARRQKK